MIRTKEEYPASLIVRLPNWVGDVIMSLPALQAMQESGIELLLYGKPWINDLLAALNMPLFSLTKQFWQTTTKMAEMPSDKTLLLTNSFSSALMARLAGKKAIGYVADSRRLLLNAGLSKQPGKHEVNYFWDIAKFASQHWFPALPWPDNTPNKITLPINAVCTSSAQQALSTAKINKPFWVLCPFAFGTGKNDTSKIWPHWRELSATLSLSHQMVVCPGRNEENLCSELVPNATVLSGLHLGEYAAVLAAAERVIANDSGPMHIAAAVGTNTLGIFGVTEPQRSQPWGSNYIGSLGHWPTIAEVLACMS
jgi:heptosyltransferase-2